jgi:hypothetical protein
MEAMAVVGTLDGTWLHSTMTELGEPAMVKI